jgi:hypothetical protein
MYLALEKVEKYELRAIPELECKIAELSEHNVRLEDRLSVAIKSSDYWQEKHAELNQPIKDNCCETLKIENAQLKEQVQTWASASLRIKDESLNKSIDQLVIIADLREENTKLKTELDKHKGIVQSQKRVIEGLRDDCELQEKGVFSAHDAYSELQRKYWNECNDKDATIKDLREENKILNEEITTLKSTRRYATNAKNKDFSDEYYRRGEEIKALKSLGIDSDGFDTTKNHVEQLKAESDNLVKQIIDSLEAQGLTDAIEKIAALKTRNKAMIHDFRVLTEMANKGLLKMKN